MKHSNEVIINLAKIYIMSVINIIGLVIVLSLKKLVDMSVKILALEKGYLRK